MCNHPFSWLPGIWGVGEVSPEYKAIINLVFVSHYLPTDAQESCFKRMLIFTLKQHLHVSVHHHHQEARYLSLLKL
jgi:hypothetical protein